MGKFSRKIVKKQLSLQGIQKQRKKQQRQLKKQKELAEILHIVSKPDTLVEEKVDEKGHKYLHIVEGGKKVEDS